MTKRWGPNLRSEATKTKRSAAKKERRAATNEIEKWCKEQGATESVTFDRETGELMRTFTFKL